jgi:hypothetical protein
LKIAAAGVQTVTPEQHARCIVAAAPHLPDILYVCSQLYVEEHGLSAEQLDILPDMDSICSDMSSYGYAHGPAASQSLSIRYFVKLL